MEKNIYVLTADMENRRPEEVARDFTNQISDLFDKLVEEQKEKFNKEQKL